jgi:mannose/cellobiose epimerase-like protein (N-acyl-D-glucosamine 2-epimerase family)
MAEREQPPAQPPSGRPSGEPSGHTYSDTLTGLVSAPFADDCFELTTLDGERHRVEVTVTTAAELLHNLGEPYEDVTQEAPGMLGELGRELIVEGVCYPRPGGSYVEAKGLVFLGRGPREFRFEEPSWWIRQLDELAAFYRQAQFGDGEVDYRDYRTVIKIGGDKTGDHVQETDTISRMVYGMSAAFMLTGREPYLEVAEKGAAYLRENLRFVDTEADVTYWYHGLGHRKGRTEKLLTSEFGDDYDAIPMYEQIYALTGLTMAYRIGGDPRLRADIDATLKLFERFFRDGSAGGYFSHVDPVTMSPHHESLGPNRSRKNWNSIGDHAPAYLINLFLATGEQRHAEMLERTFDAIVAHFPDPDGNPFVFERFHADWTPDTEHGWQQDRAVIGHNMKIAWNLSRMQSLRPKDEYVELAGRIGNTLPIVGSDRRRGGWYDVVERQRRPDEEWHRFAWHDHKAWWQQEQAILGFLLLAGTRDDPDYLAEFRHAAAFYNTFFLDHDDGGVFFTVLANGNPYVIGSERLKGSHSMSMYHAAELCFLSAIYTELLVRRRPLDLWFKPHPDGFGDGVLRVAPDLLPPGSVRLVEVELDGRPHPDFDAAAMTVALPPRTARVTVRARVAPAGG